MNVPLLDLKAQYRVIKSEVMAAIEAVCDEQGFVLGPRLTAFEEATAQYIGSRYASFCHFIGADVAIWDSHARDPCFHRAGARREYFLERLVQDAEIFATMLPLTPQTEGLVRAEYIQALPKGCLVVMVTRARICDCDSLYERVLKDELALAADVFDGEPLAIGHPLLGRHNVVHTPHNAGRTKEANWRFAEMLADQFSPV